MEETALHAGMLRSLFPRAMIIITVPEKSGVAPEDILVSPTPPNHQNIPVGVSDDPQIWVVPAPPKGVPVSKGVHVLARRAAANKRNPMVLLLSGQP